MIGDLEEARVVLEGDLVDHSRGLSPPFVTKRGDVWLNHHILRTQNSDAPGRRGISRPGKHSQVCGREHEYMYFKD